MTTDVDLSTLEAKGLIRLATVRPELEYLFRHGLVQDAAYESLLKQERRELHGLVGDALESLYPDRRAELAPVLAMHFEQAGATDKAIDYYLEGGDHAAARNAIREAFAAYDRAADLIATAPAPNPADEAAVERAQRRDLRAQLGRAEVGYSFRNASAMFEELDRIVALADQLGDLDLIVRIHMLIALGRLQSGESPDDPIVRRSLDRLRDVADATGAPATAALPVALVGMAQVFAGPVRAGVRALEEALPALETGPDSIGAAFARGSLALGYGFLGEFDKAVEAAARARELAARGDMIAQLDALIAESGVNSLMGRLDRAIPLAKQCVETAEETGASGCVLASSWILGDAFLRVGRYEEARDVLQRGSDVSRLVARRLWRPTLQAWLGSAAAALGQVAEEDWDEAIRTARSIHNRVGEAGVVSKRAEARARNGDLEGSIADFAAAAAVYDAEGTRPMLARTLRAWGDALRTNGKLDEARPILERARVLFEELGLDGEASGVRTSLALGDRTLSME